ncbi:MAG: hypothetical protein IPK00_20220 [Deltaproteobacteria bacterium]|nr:hypothetical protein [Deltaproteobacteria bacterium]
MNFRSFLLALTFALSSGVATAARVEIIDGDNVDFVASTSRGLKLQFRKPDLVFRIGGRLQADAAFFDADATDADADGKLRRGRLYLSGRVLDDFGFKIEREFAPDRGEFRNLWLSYRLNSHVRFKAGNFVSPFGLEQVASSNLLTFMERAMSGAIAPSFQTGGRVDTAGRFAKKKSRHRWTWALAVGAEPMGQVSDDTHRSEHWSVTSRATYAPIARKKLVLHLGGSAEYRDVLGDSVYRIATSPESSLGPRFLSTGGLQDVDSVVSAGAEAAALFGPVLLQGEYQRAFLQRETGGDVDLGGGYVQASWVVTGERREYSRRSGTFGSLEPRSDWGALELAARYSVLDLNDADVIGGEAENWTVGANWYVRRNLRFMFNYVRVHGKQRITDTSDDPQIFQFRAQLFF